MWNSITFQLFLSGLAIFPQCNYITILPNIMDMMFRQVQQHHQSFEAFDDIFLLQCDAYFFLLVPFFFHFVQPLLLMCFLCIFRFLPILFVILTIIILLFPLYCLFIFIFFTILPFNLLCVEEFKVFLAFYSDPH